MHGAMVEVLLCIAGIIVPAVLLTLLCRRWVGEPRWRDAMLMLALSIAFVGTGLRPSTMPVPLDEITRGDPFRNAVSPSTPRNALTNDTVKLFLPWMDAAREELFAGRLPIWNRYSFSGYPLLANGESAPLSPFFLCTLFVPLPRQIIAMAALKTFVALLGAFLATRQFALSRAEAGIVAVSFALSTYQTVYLYYSAATISALLPFAALSLLRVVRSRARGDSLAVVITVAALMSAGHPESVMHVAVTCAVLLVVELVVHGDRREFARGFLRACAAAIAGLLLSAVTWVPVLEQVRISQRIDEIARARTMTEPFPAMAAWALISPDAFGNPAHGNWSWVMNYATVASSFAGLAVLAAVIVALAAPRVPMRVRLWAAGAVALFLVAMSWPPLGGLNRLPPLSLVANDKLRFGCVFVAALAAAGVVDRAQRVRWWWLASASAVSAAWLVLASAHFGRHFGVAAAVSIVAIVAITIAAFAPRVSAHLASVALACVTLELVVLNVPFNAPAPRSHYAPRVPLLNALRTIAPAQPFRIAGHEWVMIPNVSTHYGLEDVRGSDPMAWGRYIDYLSLAAVESRGMDVRRIIDVTAPALDFLNVRYLIAEPGFEGAPGWVLRYAERDGTIFENLQYVERFFTPVRLRSERGDLHEQLAEIADSGHEVVVRGLESDATNPPAVIRIAANGASTYRLRVNASQPTFVASSVPALPGWRVSVNGERATITRVNGAFVGFRVPAGASDVEVSYLPRSITISAAGSLASLLLLTLWWRRTTR